jgi:hypothetical protein
MMKFTLLLCMTFGLLITVIGSQNQEQTQLFGIDNNEISISQKEVVVGAASYSNVSLEVSSQKPFYVICNADWLSYDTHKNNALSPDKTILRIIANRNPFAKARTGTVRVYNDFGGDQLILVTQTGNTLNYLEINTNKLTINASEDSIFQVDINSNAAWTTSSNQSWITVSKSAGTGNGAFGISAASNPSSSKREAVVTVSIGSITKTINVIQWGQTQKVLEVSTNNLLIMSYSWADSVKVDITSNTTWTATSNHDWVTVSPETGSNNGSIYIYVSDYEDISRDGTITITGVGTTPKTIIVNQKSSEDYYITVPKTSYTINSIGFGLLEIPVSSNTSWSAWSNFHFYEYTPSTGFGNGSILIVAHPLDDDYDSELWIEQSNYEGGIEPIQLIITTKKQSQAYLEPNALNASIAAEGDSAAWITVYSNLIWTATSNQPWLSLSNTTFDGYGQFSLTAAANTGSATRYGTITISAPGYSSKTISVTQPGNGIEIPKLETFTSALEINAANGSTRVIEVSSNLNWTASSNQSWLTLSNTSGSNDGSITITATANNSNTPRQAFVTLSAIGVSSVTITVTQAAAATTYTLAVSSNSVNIAAPAGSTASVTVTSNIAWTAASNQSWLTVSPTSGSNNGALTFTAAVNTASTTRQAIVTVSGTGVNPVSITITQAAAATTHTLAVSSNSVNIAAPAGSTASVAVTSNTAWTTASNQSWLTVSPASGSNNGALTFTATANTGSTTRQAIVTVSGTGVNPVSITVTQAAAAATHTLAVSSNSVNIAAPAGSTASVAVTSNTAWTTASNQSWLTVSPTSGSNNGALTFTAAVNTASTTRQATVTVSGTGVNPVSITITQAAAATTNTLAVSSNSVNIAAPAGSTASVTVTSNIAWTAASNQSWLTVSPTSGSNNGTLTFTAAANTASTTRQAIVTVSGTGVNPVSITVTQDAASILIIDESSTNITIGPESGTTITISIQSNTSWTATSNQAWLHVSPASGTNNGTVTVGADPNTLPNNRQGTITITANGVSITIIVNQTGNTGNLINVTFSVDMTYVNFSSNEVFLSGSFTNWEGKIPLTANGNIWSATIQLPKNETIYYKFLYKQGTTELWEDKISGSCASTDEWKNRIFKLPNNEVILDLVYYNRCNHIALEALAGPDQTVTEGDNVSLSGNFTGVFQSNAVTYQWVAPEGITLSSNSAQKPTFTAPQVDKDAYYVLMLIVSSGAVTSAPDEVTILVKNNPVSSTVHSYDAEVKVYPNPSSGVFEVDPGVHGGNYQITVSNSIGARVYQTEMSQSGKVLVDISNQRQGIYFVNVKNDKINRTIKIIIK